MPPSSLSLLLRMGESFFVVDSWNPSVLRFERYVAHFRGTPLAARGGSPQCGVTSAIAPDTRRRDDVPIAGERQLRRWSDTAVTLWADEGSCHGRRQSPVMMKAHHSVLALRLRLAGPVRATLETSASGC